MDPYKVLEIEEYATDEEIKEAYRRAVKKYHPDRYIGNPLFDLAEEKIKQINEAYEQIATQRNHRCANLSDLRRNDCYFYSDIENMISAGNILEAERLLEKIKLRDGKWFYYKGNIFRAKGWYEEALICFKKCCEFEPDNSVYSDAFCRSSAHSKRYESESYFAADVRRNKTFKSCIGGLCDFLSGDAFICK